MTLRLFIDQCVPTEAVRPLRDAGFDVILLRQHLAIDSADPLVIAKAQDLDAILVSINGDFMDIVNYPPSRYGGIIGLQLHNRPECVSSVMARLLGYMRGRPDRAAYVGKLLIVEPHRVRVRSEP